MIKILKKMIVRSDTLGSGFFGSDRGSKIHEGTDFLAKEGENVYAPEFLTFIKDGYVYDNDFTYKYSEYLSKSGLFYRFFYFKRFKKSLLAPGSLIGNVQDISLKYGPSMDNHLHIEIRKNNQLINPLSVLKLEDNNFYLIILFLIFLF